MHIAHITASMSPRYGGPPQVARGLGNAFLPWGHTVSYWAPDSGDGSGPDAALPSDVREFPRARPGGWYRAPKLGTELKRQMASIDILHVHEVWSYPQLVSSRIARCRQTPYVIMPHGELEARHLGHGGAAKQFKKRAYLALVGRAMLRGAACLHALTPQEADGFRQVGYQGPVAVIPNGVDPAAFATLPEDDVAERMWPQLQRRRVVLFLSRLSPEKGLDRFLPAWGRLVRQSSYRDALLVLAGPSHQGYATEVRRLIDRSRTSDHVLLTGMVSGREKEAIVARADLFTLPSHCEGFSMAVLENMAAGKPVLITPGCNFPEVARADAGRCVPPEPEALEQAVAELLDLSPLQRQAMGQRGRRLVLDGYTWDVAARKLLTVYHSILAGRPAPLHPKPAPLSSSPAIPAERAA